VRRCGPAFGLCALLLLACLASAAGADEVAAGRRIFHRGTAEGGIVATYGRSSATLPSAALRCAGCHGPDGAGGREGGIAIPPITAADLAAARAVAPGRPGRPGYDEPALQRAITEGIDSSGRRLTGMPNFRLTSEQAGALTGYLRVLGTERDADPGVTANEIGLGAVLPLSGPRAAWGEAMRDALEGALTRAGEIYGRRLRLVATDAGDDAARSLRRLAASDRVFALVAPHLSGAEAAEDLEDLPIIGPLAPTPARPESNRFYLLATVEDQMRVLVDDIVAGRPGARLAVIGSGGNMADTVADQAARAGATAVLSATVEKLAAIEPAPDAIIALPGTDLASLLSQLPDRLAATVIAAPAESLALGAAHDERLRLVLPVLPADPRGHEVSANVPPLAAAAAAVLVEGIKRMGARATRARLIAAIETLRGFQTGVLPPLTFRPGQHIGSRASVVVRPDKARGLIVLGDWRTPR
jgi:ABC-type branched-subunit amino acid transport system substrate-binding protein